MCLKSVLKINSARAEYLRAQRLTSEIVDGVCCEGEDYDGAADHRGPTDTAQPPGLAQSEYDKAFDSWQSFEDKSATTGRLRSVGLALVGVLYAASWWDVMSPSSDASRVVVLPMLAADRNVIVVALIRRI